MSYHSKMYALYKFICTAPVCTHRTVYNAVYTLFFNVAAVTVVDFASIVGIPVL